MNRPHFCFKLSKITSFITYLPGPSWSWLYGSWIYKYLCNQCLSPIMLWVRIPLRRGVLDITFCDKVCQLLAVARWLFPGTPVSSTNKTEILLKVTVNFITLTLHIYLLNTEILIWKRNRYFSQWNYVYFTTYYHSTNVVTIENIIERPAKKHKFLYDTSYLHKQKCNIYVINSIATYSCILNIKYKSILTK
jgi:hypothetical protein